VVLNGGSAVKSSLKKYGYTREPVRTVRHARRHFQTFSPMRDNLIMTHPDNIPCPHCLQPVEFNASKAGQFGKCPSCRDSFRMPDESTCVTDPQLLVQIQSRDTLRNIRTAVIALILWLLLSGLL
jgi:hypothetical protein